MPITYTCSTAQQLSLEQFYALLKLRQDVFTLEQQCLWNDLDGLDLKTLHLTAWDQNTLAGCARLDIEKHPHMVKFQRLAVHPAYRHMKIGSALLSQALAYCDTHHTAAVCLEAQSHLEAFYASFGFVTQGPAYMDAGIEHVPMKRSKPL